MPTSWTDRFPLYVQQLWRELQAALHDERIALAESLESRLRMAMGVSADRPLPEVQLQRAAYPTKSKRPEMIPVAVGRTGGHTAPAEEPSLGRTPDPISPAEEPAPPPASPTGRSNGLVGSDAPTSPDRRSDNPTSDAELLDLHRQHQAALAQYGDTEWTRRLTYDLVRMIARHLDVDIGDREALDQALDLLHREAYPRKRPARFSIWA